MAARDVEIRIGLTGATATKAQLKSVERSFDLMGGGLGNLGKEARALDPRMAVAVAALEAAARAAVATTVALAGTAIALDRLGRHGSTVSAIATAFEQIASPSLLGRLREATSGVVADLDLMQHSARALRTGFGSEDEIVGWFETVRVAAVASGRDLADSFERLAGILSGDELSLFEDLGVNVTALEERLDRLGIQSESAQGRVELLRMAVTQLNGQFGVGGDRGPEAYGVTIASLGTTIRNFGDQVARAFAESPRLAEWLAPLTGAFAESLPLAQQWGDRLVTLFIAVAEGLRDIARVVVPVTEAFLELAAGALYLGRIITPINGLYELTNNAARAMGDLSVALNAVTESTVEGVTAGQSLANAHASAAQSAQSLGSQIMDLAESIFGNSQAVRENIRQQRDQERMADQMRAREAELNREIRDGEVVTRALALAELQGLQAKQQMTRAAAELSRADRTLTTDAEGARDGVISLTGAMRTNSQTARESRASLASYVEEIRAIRTEAVNSGQALINLSAVQAMSEEQRRTLGEARLRQGIALLDHDRQANQEREQISEDERKRREEAEAALGREAERAGAQIQAEIERAQAERRAGAAARRSAERDAERQLEEERREAQEERMRLATREHEDRMEQEREFREEQAKNREEEQAALEQQLEMERRAAEWRRTIARLEEEDTKSARAAQMEQIEAAFDSSRQMASAAKGFFGEISNALEATGVSTEKAKKAEGAFIIAYSSVMAVLEVAEAVKSFAKQEYAQGAMHLLAMGGYVAAAVAAASQLGGGSPKAAPVAATFTASDRSQQQPQSEDEGGRTVVNNYSLGYRNGDLGGTLERARYDATKFGARTMIPSNVSFA